MSLVALSKADPEEARAEVMRLLHSTGGNVAAARKIVGMPHATFYLMLKRLGMRDMPAKVFEWYEQRFRLPEVGP